MDRSSGGVQTTEVSSPVGWDTSRLSTHSAPKSEDGVASALLERAKAHHFETRAARQMRFLTVRTFPTSGSAKQHATT